MKILLVTVNVVLAFIALGVVHHTFVGSKKADAIVTAVVSGEGSAKGGKSKKSASARKNVRRMAAKNLPTLEEAEKKVIALDVFNKVRSPLANERTTRSQMTLVGTFTMGNVKGAIIRQQNAARQFNPYLAQAMMAGGGNRGNMQGRGGMRGGGNRGNMQGRGGRGFSNWSQLSSGRTNTTKQYVRVGDTLSNGYTLTEVSRTHAVLLRGNDKMELELQDPSRNRAAARRSTPHRMNSTQQFQQAQMIMQRQMMNTMRQMQNTMQRQNSGGGGGARRR